PPPAHAETLAPHDALPIYEPCQKPAARPARKREGSLVFRGDLADDGKAEPGARLALIEPLAALHRLADLVRLQPRPVVLHLDDRSEEHTSALQSRENLVCR